MSILLKNRPLAVAVVLVLTTSILSSSAQDDGRYGDVPYTNPLSTINASTAGDAYSNDPALEPKLEYNSDWTQGQSSQVRANVAVATAAADDASKPKYPTFKVGGFFQLDSLRFAQSSQSQAILGDIQDGTGFRRARLLASGNIAENASYLMEFDFAQGAPRFIDVWGQFDKTPIGAIRIGRFRQPFGMTELTSVRELPFLERPTVFALAPFRQTGIMISNKSPNEDVTLAVSAFRSFSDNFGNVFGDDGGLGTAERLTFLPAEWGDGNVLHVGVDHSFFDPARNQLQIASQDEAVVGQNPNFGPGGLSVLPIVFVPAFVNSGTFPVDHVNVYNLEFAAAMGRAAIQSEFRWSHVNLPTGESTTLPAAYVEARYVLTGESIPYNKSNAVLGRVKPRCPVNAACGQWGAWEVAFRYSTIDLNSLVGLPGVTGPGRRLQGFNFGLNWYLLDNAKWQFDWINGSLNDVTIGDGVSNTFASRVQFDF